MRIDNIKQSISRSLSIPPEDVDLACAPASTYSDFSISVFKQAKYRNINPIELAKVVADGLASVEGITSATSVGGYVNISVGYKILFEIVEEILKEPASGFRHIGQGKRARVKYFSPNTNKP